MKLELNGGKLSGKSYFNKPLTYRFKKQLIQDVEISRMLEPKKIRNGKKIN
jgi:hypothetical protein